MGKSSNSTGHSSLICKVMTINRPCKLLRVVFQTQRALSGSCRVTILPASHLYGVCLPQVLSISVPFLNDYFQETSVAVSKVSLAQNPFLFTVCFFSKSHVIIPNILHDAQWKNV